MSEGSAGANRAKFEQAPVEEWRRGMSQSGSDVHARLACNGPARAALRDQPAGIPSRTPARLCKPRRVGANRLFAGSQLRQSQMGLDCLPGGPLEVLGVRLSLSGRRPSEQGAAMAAPSLAGVAACPLMVATPAFDLSLPPASTGAPSACRPTPIEEPLAPPYL